ncbi:MAG: sugar phosphate isomerase/epimerase [Chthoniobacteraceae bacterium]
MDDNAAPNGHFSTMKFGICNEIFQDWTIEDTFTYAAKTGYDLVEIAPFTLAGSVTEISPARRIELRDAAARAGIGISGLHWVLVKTEGLHLTSPDAAVRQRTSRYFTDIVDCCADIGGTRIVLGSPKQRNVGDGISHEQAWAWAAGTLRDAVKHAEDRGVVICFEPLAPVETNFVNTAAEGIRFAAQFASPAMSIILDVKAMSAEETPIPQIIRESAGKFEYFHANDRNLKGPGFGEVDFRPIAAALRDAAYDGIVSVEVFDFTEGPEVIATKSLGYLREVFGEA